MLVFVRHAGCTFCREMLADLAAARAEIERRGITIAVAHMSSPIGGRQLLARFGLDDLHNFSDRRCELYREFGLERGSLWRLLGPKVWVRAPGALARGCGLGAIDGDGFRMAGVFLFREGRQAAAHRHRSAADRADFLALAGQLDQPEATPPRSDSHNAVSEVPAAAAASPAEDGVTAGTFP